MPQSGYEHPDPLADTGGKILDPERIGVYGSLFVHAPHGVSRRDPHVATLSIQGFGIGARRKIQWSRGLERPDLRLGIDDFDVDFVHRIHHHGATVTQDDATRLSCGEPRVGTEVGYDRIPIGADLDQTTFLDDPHTTVRGLIAPTDAPRNRPRDRSESTVLDDTEIARGGANPDAPPGVGEDVEDERALEALQGDVSEAATIEASETSSGRNVEKTVPHLGDLPRIGDG